MNKTLIFVGPLKKTPDNGVAMKNHLFVERFKEVFDKVIAIDGDKPKKRPWCIAEMVVATLLHPNATIAVSFSVMTGDKVLRLLRRLNRKNIYYWAVGGTLHQRLVELGYDLDTYKKLDAIYVQSEKIVSGLKALGINNSIKVDNSKRIDYYPVLHPKNSSDKRFVFFSRVHPEKGCQEIINCTKRLNDLGYKFVVDFYGALDKDYQDFPSRISDVHNISYKGFLDIKKNEGYDTLASYDVMLFPTYWMGEGFPGVVIDAYIAGLPIIASDWNCNEEVIDERTGVIIPHHDEEALFTAMKKVLDNEYNLDAMSIECQKRASQYDNRIVLSVENLKKIGFIK